MLTHGYFSKPNELKASWVPTSIQLRSSAGVIPADMALKVVDLGINRRMVQFLRELQVLKRVSGHPNLVQFYGAGQRGLRFVFYAMEILSTDFPTWSAHQFKAQPPTHELPYPSTPHREMLQVQRDCARGVEGLHQLGVVHMDLVSHNMMIAHTHNGVVGKVTDYGLARLLAESQGQALDPKQVRRQAPPELVVTTAYDVYMFVVCCLFEATQQQVWFAELTIRQTVKAIMAGRRPDIIVPLQEAYLELIWACTSIEPSERLNAATLVDALNKLL